MKSKSSPAESCPELKLDRSSYVPYYEQIVSSLRQAIQANALTQGQVIWSQRELAEMLGISVLPVKRAYERLRTEGLLVVSKGKRPVVGAGSVPWNVQQMWSFTEAMRARGLSASSRLLSFAAISADKEVADALQLEEGSAIYSITRVRSAPDGPVSLETSYVPGRLFPNLEARDWSTSSLYDVIETAYGYRIDSGEERFSAVKAGDDEARWLKVEVGFPLLSCQRVIRDSAGVPLEYGLSLLRTDRFVARLVMLRRGSSRQEGNGAEITTNTRFTGSGQNS